ncbi:hypothetical protein Tco_0672259, partial [Tanacetum coccineum]
NITARDRQKSYADKRRKPLEFSIGDYVLLKVSPWKGVVRFGKKGKLAPRSPLKGLHDTISRRNTKVLGSLLCASSVRAEKYGFGVILFRIANMDLVFCEVGLDGKETF